MKSKTIDTTYEQLKKEYTPPFTVKDLRESIPAHLWERSTIKSFAYTLYDLTIVIALGWIAANYLDHPNLPLAAKFVLWPAYWFAQGLFCTGLWVIAHECGHRAFSSNQFICDVVGLVLHSALLVPYHNWRLSHHRHHMYTGSIEHDEVFVPVNRAEVKAYMPVTKAKVLINIVLTLLLGWPLYLLFNVTGNKTYGDKHVDHFNPSSPIFKPKDRAAVILSDVVLGLVLFTLAYCTYNFGFLPVLKVYVIPYFGVNLWLVLITKLHHTDKDLPHYRDDEWNWLRGQLSTKDRTYGYVLDTILHNITNTHVCHHLFPQLPHYNAVEATEHLKKKLGKFYREDPRSLWEQIYATFDECQFVEEEDKIAMFKRNLDE